MSMTTEDALLAAVWASPHDDLPRLVYADWLDESGDPANAARAEFIRVQCELARLGGRDDDRWVPLKMAESRIFKQYGERFRREVGGKIKRGPFRRGFPAPYRDVVLLDTLLGWPYEVLNRAPLWEFSVNYRTPERVPELLTSPRLRRLGFLGVWATDDAMAITLAASPHSVNLAGIDFRRGTVTAVGMRAIAHSPHLPHLRELIVSLKHPEALDVAFAQELANSPLAERLRVLDISDCSEAGRAAVRVLRERFGERLVMWR